MFATSWLDETTLMVLTTHARRGNTVLQIDSVHKAAMPTLTDAVGAWETLLVDTRAGRSTLWLSDGDRRAPRLLRLERDAAGSWQTQNSWGDAIGHGHASAPNRMLLIATPTSCTAIIEHFDKFGVS